MRLDFCTFEAAKFAVEKWHYSHRMPAGALVRIGVWEGGQFIGCVLFGKGASPPLLKRLKSLFGISQHESCELVRVALTNHQAQVSRIVRIALALLKRQCPGLRLVVSFADADQDHHGGIYQAGGWIYGGLRMPGITAGYIINGQNVHCRSMPAKGVRNTLEDALRLDARATRIVGKGKHQYFYPLDRAIAAEVQKLSQPYPKRAGSIASDATANHADQGGATPTSALSSPIPPSLTSGPGDA